MWNEGKYSGYYEAFVISANKANSSRPLPKIL